MKIYKILLKKSSKPILLIELNSIKSDFFPLNSCLLHANATKMLHSHTNIFNYCRLFIFCFLLFDYKQHEFRFFGEKKKKIE